ncbi:HAD hydrolase-like protein [Fontimonas sp. SYSU GA230001]|uniref:HAD hydrolase-like protein n=1 Tax=Fontimonas sp. SYSU GA230001 TaxID=3142450 RepID=UPI0032B5FCA5
MDDVELLIFDLDGTLVDTAPEIADTVNDVLAEAGLAARDPAHIRTWIGHGARATLKRALLAQPGDFADRTDIDALLDPLMRRFDFFHGQRCGTTGEPFPGVRATLDALCARGQRMALLTNKEARFTAQVLRRHDLQGFFDPVISGDSLDDRKPSAKPVRHCLAWHGTTAGRTVLVGDSGVDAQTARNSGIRFWAVPYGYNGSTPIEATRPDRLLSHFGELLERTAAPARALAGRAATTR